MLLAGKKVAWNAFAILDAFGQKAPPLHAAKDLVDNVMAAVTQAGHVVKIPEGANSEEVTCALQLSFVEALPQAWPQSSSFVVWCCSSAEPFAFVNDHIFLSILSFPLICQGPA